MFGVVARRIAIAAGFAAISWATHPWWLRQAGLALVHVDEPKAADLIVVLAGDWSGERILKAAELARSGLAPRVLASGATIHFGVRECALAIDLAVRSGHPRDRFECFERDAHSTREEATKMLPALRDRGVRSVILVTNDAHTARARYIWKKLAPWLDVRVTASNADFQKGEWWRDREGWKEFHNEVLKRITSTFDL